MNPVKQVTLKIFLISMTGVIAILINNPVMAAENDKWTNEITVYGWLSDISGTLQNGADFTYDVEDILDNLEMVLMGGYEGRIDRWSFLADLVYLDVGDRANTTVPAGAASANLDLSSWIVSAAVGYDLVQTDVAQLAVVGGLRYLDVEVDSELSLEGYQVSNRSRSKDLLDGIIGIRGWLSLGDGWFLPYYADIGTGESDLSYQLFGGIGYRFGWGDIRLGYRYLCIELDDILDDLTISGPVLGVGFRF